MKHFAFTLVVLAYLGFLGFINVLMFLPGNWISAMGHFSFVDTGDTHNLIHELVFAFIVGTAAVGLVSQLFKPKEGTVLYPPKENFAGQLIALIAWVAMIVMAALTNNWVPQPLFFVFGGLTLVATILHPAGLGLFNWIRTAKVNKMLLTLSIIAALPFTVFAFSNINLQLAGGGSAGFFNHNPPAFHGSTGNIVQEDSDDMTKEDKAVHDQEHSAVGHYRNMAALSFTIILIGFLASFRPRLPAEASAKAGGWRLAVWIAGFLPIFLGLASVILPDAESSLGLFWGIAAIVWGIAFIATAKFTS